MYTPDNLSTAEKVTFDRWYDTQGVDNANFDREREPRSFCVSDMRLLRDGCLTFPPNFKQRTQFCPFEKMTISGACTSLN